MENGGWSWLTVLPQTLARWNDDVRLMAELFGAVGMRWDDGGAVKLAVVREGDVHHDDACIFSMFVVAGALS